SLLLPPRPRRRRQGQRAAGPQAALPRQLLRRIRARCRRQQCRSGLPRFFFSRPKARLARTFGQGELAGGHTLLALLFLPHRILLGLPVIGAVHVLVREVHPDQLAVFEHEARRAGPVRVLLLLAVFAEDGGELVRVGLAVVGFLVTGRLAGRFRGVGR